MLRSISTALILALLPGGATASPASAQDGLRDEAGAAQRKAAAPAVAHRPFQGVRAGDEREVGGLKLCWCPPGRFVMGSPPGEPERRPDETQVEVTLSRGFWAGKCEVTQGQ